MRARISISKIIPVLLILAGLGWLSRAVYFDAKAAVATELITRAWDTTLRTDRPHHPWPWADFVPVGRLTVERLDIERPILSGAAGESLAFGLGHIHGTTAVGNAGNAVIAGHRNSWAEFLFDLQPGDEIKVETDDGDDVYIVITQSVVSDMDGSVLEPTLDQRLTLLTCYPRHGPVPSTQRWSVICRKQSEAPKTGKKENKMG